MERPIKWHIWENKDKKYPLCWGKEALEFDTKEAAETFLNSIKETENAYVYQFYLNSFIDKSILYYDGGYLNATNKRVIYDEEGLECLIDVE